jgi:hypothetical protein
MRRTALKEKVTVVGVSEARRSLTRHAAAVVWPTQQSALQQVSGIPQRAEEPRGTRPESPLQGAQLPQMLTAPRPLRIP